MEPDREAVRLPLSEDQWSCLRGHFHLPSREADVMRCLVEGNDERSTAQALGLSVHTVHAYARRLHDRLSVSTRSQLVGAVFRAYMHLFSGHTSPTRQTED